MSNDAHKVIEDVLNAVRKSIRDIDKDAERLSEDGLISESSDPLYQHIRELRTLQRLINALVDSVLSDEFSPGHTKKLLIQTHTLRLLSDESNKHSALAALVAKLNGED